MIAEAAERFNENIARVRNLQAVYKRYLQRPGSGRRSALASDVLRSAVVLLHASLEELLRSLLMDRLPGADEDMINEVPLTGLSKNARAEKFFLGKLIPFRAEKVQDVFDKSIAEYLDTVSFNNVGDIIDNSIKNAIRYEHPGRGVHHEAKRLCGSSPCPSKEGYQVARRGPLAQRDRS